MSLTLILPWFPIVLAVGVGARLLDRVRGIGFGILGALFWVVLVQAVTGPAVFTQLWTVMALVSGSAAIVVIGAWSGAEARQPTAAVRGGRVAGLDSAAGEAVREQDLISVLAAFGEWLEAHRRNPDPWPDWAEFVRWALNELAGATHVHLYRILTDSEQLVPLRAVKPGDQPDAVSARHGIVGHVVTSGSSYVAGDPAQGRLVDHLAEASDQKLAWCFALRYAGRKVGVVRVGRLRADVEADRARLGMVELLINQFWSTLTEVCRAQNAESRDPASGLPSREPFLADAQRALAEAYAQQEPVVVAVIAMEGMRTLSDRGDWEAADELAREASRLLKGRLRADDRLGRFDDSRFVILLRRVDSALGSLIVDQLWHLVNDLCADVTRWRVQISVRCGVAGSGNEAPPLSQLISRAIEEYHQARRQVLPISSDLEVPAANDDTEGAGRAEARPEPARIPVVESSET